MALKVYYSPIVKGEENGTPYEYCYMPCEYYVGVHVACRINGKGFLVVADEKDVPDKVGEDPQIEDLGYLESSNVLTSNTTKTKLGDMDISTIDILSVSNQDQLFKKLLYHNDCGVDVEFIKNKIASGKNCFIGLKTARMDF